VTENYGFFKLIVRIQKIPPDPEKIPLIMIFQGNSRPQAGMNKDERFLLIIKLKVLKKLEVLGNHPYSSLGLVTLQGFPAAVGHIKEHILSLKVIKQHSFMVPLQKNRCRVAVAKFEEKIENSTAIGSAIDIVAEKYKPVVVLGLDPGNQTSELFQAAVNIPDRQKPSLSGIPFDLFPASTFFRILPLL